MQIDDFDVYFGFDPNQVVIRGRRQHVQVTSRDGYVHDFMVEDAIKLAKTCLEVEDETDGLGLVRLRHYWGDNSNGNARAVVEVLHNPGASVDKSKFRFPSTTRNGQTLDVEVRTREVDKDSDHFEANASKFYKGEV